VVFLSIHVGIFRQESRTLLLVEGQDMKPSIWAGIVLVVLGALALAYQGVNYTRKKDVVDLGSIHVTTETQERIPLPPVLGGLALAGGIVLMVIGTRKKS
jgi:hypothetical protein